MTVNWVYLDKNKKIKKYLNRNKLPKEDIAIEIGIFIKSLNIELLLVSNNKSKSNIFINTNYSVDRKANIYIRIIRARKSCFGPS